MENDLAIPNWSMPATKGEVLQVMVMTKKLTNRMISVMLKAKSGDDVAYFQALDEVFDANREMDNLWNQIAGLPNE